MFEVFLGDPKKGRMLQSCTSQTEAIAFAKRNIFRYGGQRLCVIEEQMDRASGLFHRRTVWQSDNSASPDRDKLVEDARFRRNMIRK